MTFALGPRATSAGYRLFAFDKAGSTNAEAMSRARDPGPPGGGSRVFAFDRAGSTSGGAMSRARDGGRGPAGFFPWEQGGGGGRGQRAWIAPRGTPASGVREVMDVAPAVAATLGF